MTGQLRRERRFFQRMAFCPTFRRGIDRNGVLARTERSSTALPKACPWTTIRMFTPPFFVSYLPYLCGEGPKQREETTQTAPR
jgi:hypothetical protein